MSTAPNNSPSDSSSTAASAAPALHSHPIPDPAGLATLLAGWLPDQRWCAVTAGTAIEVEVLTATPLRPDDPVFDHVVVAVRTPGAAPQVYQVPLTFRDTEPEPPATRSLIGEVDGVWVHDALRERATAELLMELLGAGRAAASVDFVLGPATGLPSTGAPRVLGVEQSNTSLVYGEDVIVKVFRRLWPGTNPDIEVGTVLTLRGTEDVPELLGSATGSWPDPGGSGTVVRGSLVMAQAFQRNASDGWDLALGSVRDLLAEADLHAEEVGGDFAAEAERLGRTVAGVHIDLAASLPTGELDAAGLRTLADLLRGRLHEAAEQAPELVPLLDGLGGVYDGLAGLAGPVPVHRVHGDLHLGQTVRTLRGWRVLDFEGEPARPITERVVLDSPLRDVAGMLRSFDYASQQGLSDEEDHPDARQRVYRAAEWRDRNAEAFCRGYAAMAGVDPRAQPELLRAYETDKAVYELLYEARYRPGWVRVPLAALTRLADSGAGTRGEHR